MKLEEQAIELSKNVLLISAENKKLEAMLKSIQEERAKFLEDNKNLEEKLSKNIENFDGASV